jgi:hypothetical protein
MASGVRFTELLAEINRRKRASESETLGTRRGTGRGFYRGKYLDYVFLDERTTMRLLSPERNYEKGLRNCWVLTSRHSHERDLEQGLWAGPASDLGVRTALH